VSSNRVRAGNMKNFSDSNLFFVEDVVSDLVITYLNFLNLRKTPRTICSTRFIEKNGYSNV